jgi:hypothetical protein
MTYYEEQSLEDKVNKKNSPLWTRMNDNSKAAFNRAAFVAEHGGFFKQEGKFWVWVDNVTAKNGYWLKRVDTGEKTFFENMTQFGKEHGLTAVKICELLNGKRKTYKGWTAVEIRAVKEDVSPHEKLKKPKKKKVPVTKSVVFKDTVTNQIIPVNNLSQFAKTNNLDYGNIKNLAKGKLKSYRNLKLYDPLEQYKDSSEPK